MIPGTSLAIGGGGALSRDVGGSGNLQQSPLQYRGSADTVQTVEGIRLNNLCAQGAYSGVYWNDGSFQEISYVTGADSAEMGQGGIRVNMVPKDGGNTFRGSIVANMTKDNWVAENLGDNLVGDLTYNANNRLVNVGEVQKIWDINPSVGGPIVRDKVWFTFTYRHWGNEKTVADSFFDLDPSPLRYTPDTSRPGVDDGHIVSRVGTHLLADQREGQDHDVSRRPEQVPRSLGHLGDDSARDVGHPGDADQLRERDALDANAHQPAAVRCRLRHLRPGVHRAVSAERAQRVQRQGLELRTRFAPRTCTPSSTAHRASARAPGTPRPTTSRCFGPTRGRCRT